MYNQVLRVVLIIGTLFPFVMVGYKLFEEESLLTAGFYTAIVVILFATILAALRARPASSDIPPPRDGRETQARS